MKFQFVEFRNFGKFGFVGFGGENENLPATVILWPYISSYSLAFMPTYAYQYWQSAAPPAKVESRNSFSSITFLQVSEELKSPIDARESTAMQTPAAVLKARHVVPFL